MQSSPRVRIVPATLRDVTFIGANLRPADAREILCQVPEGTRGSEFAASAFQTLAEGWSWIAELDGQPVCAFGFQPFTVPVWIGWAFGTRRMIRAVPAMTAHCLAQEARMIEAGVRRVEVRTITDHDLSKRWLAHLGCRKCCDLPDHGRKGEAFELWAWQLTDGRPSQRKDYRGREHVPSENA